MGSIEQEKVERVYTRAEVAKHSTPNDLWVTYQDKVRFHLRKFHVLHLRKRNVLINVWQVLDLTKWVDLHPGGRLALINMAGIDATDEMTVMHPKYVTETMVKKFVIGKVVQ